MLLQAAKEQVEGQDLGVTPRNVDANQDMQMTANVLELKAPMTIIHQKVMALTQKIPCLLLKKRKT